jgi:hypothetical protein
MPFADVVDSFVFVTGSGEEVGEKGFVMRWVVYEMYNPRALRPTGAALRVRVYQPTVRVRPDPLTTP